MSKSKKIDTEKLKNNPFVDGDFEIVVNKINDGEDEVNLERGSYSKVFRLVKNRDRVDGLSLNGKQLFLWMLYRIDYGNDWCLVDRSKYMEVHNLQSVNTYKAGVFDLVEKGVIAYTTIRDVFYINPKIFFAGSRAKKFPDKVRVYGTEKKKEEDENTHNTNTVQKDET